MFFTLFLLIYPKGMFILINHPEGRDKVSFNFYLFFFFSLEEMLFDIVAIKVLVNTSDDPF